MMCAIARLEGNRISNRLSLVHSSSDATPQCIPKRTPLRRLRAELAAYQIDLNFEATSMCDRADIDRKSKIQRQDQRQEMKGTVGSRITCLYA